MFSNLELIEEYAGMLMLPYDIADILELNRKEFIAELNDSDSDVRKAFYRGYLKTEIRIRKKNIGKQESISDVESEELFIPDVDEAKFNSEVLNNFKSKLTIQLYA